MGLLWFTTAELDDTKKNAQRLAEALENQINLCTGTMTNHHEDWRGLESHGEEGTCRAYKARADTINAVLDVQDECRAPKMRLRRRPSHAADDIALLARAAAEVSAVFAEEAVERARRDAEYAKEYCQDLVSTVRNVSTLPPLPPLIPIIAPTKIPASMKMKKKKDKSRSGNRRKMRLSITGSRQNEKMK